MPLRRRTSDAIPLKKYFKDNLLLMQVMMRQQKLSVREENERESTKLLLKDFESNGKLAF